MRITLTAAAFTIVAFLPLNSHALAGDAGEAGATASDAGATSESHGGSAGSAGSAGKGGAAGAGGAKAAATGPGPNLPDPGTDQTNSCSIGGPHGQWGVFGTTLALGAAFLTLRRRRSH